MARQAQINTIIETDPVVKNTRSDRSYRQLDIALKWLRPSEKMLNQKKVFNHLEVLIKCTILHLHHIHVHTCILYVYV